MRVRVTDLGPSGIDVKDSISLDNLNSRLNQAGDCDIVFTTHPQVSLKVHKTPNGAETTGKISANYKQACGLCLENIEREIEVDANWIFQHVSSQPTTSTIHQTDSCIDDIGICSFTGEHIELEELIQEALILSLHRYWSPPKKTDGSCSFCNKKSCYKDEQSTKTKKTTTFSELLKAANITK